MPSSMTAYGAPRVAVARLADAAGIDHLHVAQVEMELHVRVPHADEVGVDRFQSLPPRRRICQQVFIERIARRAMHQVERLAPSDDAPREGEPGQIFHAGRSEHPPMDEPRRGGQPAKAASLLGGNALRDGVVVVSADGGRRPGLHPIDAGERIGRVLDQVAEKQARVERLIDRGKRRPVRMDVGQEQDFHADQNQRPPENVPTRGGGAANELRRVAYSSDGPSAWPSASRWP